MAVLRYYDRTKHDIYAYGSDNRIPIAYSQTCQTNGIIDWSGTLPRNREFCKKVNPITVDPFMPIDWSSINFWNPCTYGLVLVSPRHALVCQHYRGTHGRPNENYSFMDRSGTRHRVDVSAVHLSVGPDLTLLEFAQELPSDRLKIYDRIANPLYIPKDTPLWMQDPNGKTSKVLFQHTMQSDAGSVYGYQYLPVKDGINDPGGINGGMCIFVGDSGSPTMISDHRGNTILVGLMYGGQCVNEQTFSAIESIVKSRGYQLTHVRMSAKAEDINQDGIIDAQDLALLMNRWGSNDPYIDMNGDGIVDSEDLSMMLNSWGSYEMQTSPNPYPTGVTFPNGICGGVEGNEEKPRK